MKSNPTSETLDLWIRRLLKEPLEFAMDFRGLPGRMRIPRSWNNEGCYKDEHFAYWVVDGSFEATFQRSKSRVRVEWGDLIWIPPGMPFHFCNSSPRLLIYRFRLKPHAPWRWNSKFQPHFREAWNCQVWMKQLSEVDFSKEHLPKLQGLLLCILSELLDLVRGQKDHKGGLRAEQRQELITYVAACVDAWPRTQDLARHLQLSHDYFTRQFKKSFGIPPQRWLIERRIHVARMLLEETTLNVSEIALQLGYSDVFFFSRQFKEVAGDSPTRYRAMGGVSEVG